MEEALTLKWAFKEAVIPSRYTASKSHSKKTVCISAARRKGREGKDDFQGQIWRVGVPFKKSCQR